MDPSLALSSLFTLPMFVLCIVIGIIVAGFRKVMEKFAQKINYILPDKYEPLGNWFWREIILPGAPLVVGASIAFFIKDYPFPEPFAASVSAKVFVGILVGLVSGWLYPRVIFYLKAFSKAPQDKTPPQ
jgi:Na+/H+-dicarboxylate symporter